MVQTKKILRQVLGAEVALIKVPKEGEYMKLIPETSFIDNESGKKVIIPEHYQHMFLAQANPKEIVIRHFYGISEEHLGKRIVAKVTIILKKVDGRSYLMMDIHHQPDKKATTEMKFTDNGTGQFFIPRTNKRIWFKPRDNQ